MSEKLKKKKLIFLTKQKEILKQYAKENNLNISELEKQEREQEISIQKSLLAKSIEVLDFQIEKLYEDKLNGLINNDDFSRMYDKKVKERETTQSKLKKLNEIKFEKQTIDYEKIINDFFKKENAKSLVLNRLSKICHNSFLTLFPFISYLLALFII